MTSYQAPAEGILTIGDYGPSKMYRVECGCGQADDSLTLDVEANDIGVNVLIYATTKSNWHSETLVERMLKRLRLTWQLWTVGYIRYEAVTSLNKQQALNFAGTIERAIADVESFRSDHNSKNM